MPGRDHPSREKVLGPQVTKIALAFDRKKASVYAALGDGWATETRGRKVVSAMAQVQVNLPGHLWPLCAARHAPAPFFREAVGSAVDN